MQTLAESMRKTTEDIELLKWNPKRGVFPVTNFEMKVFILKFVKNATFYQKWKIDIWTW